MSLSAVLPVQSVELNTCTSSSEIIFCKQSSMFTVTEIHSLMELYVGYDNTTIWIPTRHFSLYTYTLSFTPITTGSPFNHPCVHMYICCTLFLHFVALQSLYSFNMFSWVYSLTNGILLLCALAPPLLLLVIM